MHGQSRPSPRHDDRLLRVQADADDRRPDLEEALGPARGYVPDSDLLAEAAAGGDVAVPGVELASPGSSGMALEGPDGRPGVAAGELHCVVAVGGEEVFGAVGEGEGDGGLGGGGEGQVVRRCWVEGGVDGKGIGVKSQEGLGGMHARQSKGAAVEEVREGARGEATSVQATAV